MFLSEQVELMVILDLYMNFALTLIWVWSVGQYLLNSFTELAKAYIITGLLAL